MSMHRKRMTKLGLSLVCAFGMTLTSVPVYAADDVSTLEKQTNSLQKELEGYNSDLVEIGTKISDTEDKIQAADNEVYRLEASLRISRNNEETQYENMKSRIQFMYENGSTTLLTMLCEAESMSDFLNKADFIQNITEYDREMLQNLVAVREGIETQEEDLKNQQAELESLQEELEKEQDALQAKADATSTNLKEFQSKLTAAREAAAKEKAAKEEAERQAAAKAQAAAALAAQAASNSSSSSGSSSSSSSSESSSGSTQVNTVTATEGTSWGDYIIPAGGLTPSAGRITFGDHTETYYSQQVLPGGGLDIPGRHVASDGTIRDSDGYIVVASDDYSKGTVVETSLGTAKVYDCGSGSGNIDIYTDW